MDLEQLHELFEKNPNVFGFDFVGKCSACGEDAEVSIDLTEKEVKIKGGAIYGRDGNYRIKCDKCFSENPVFNQPCNVYSRVVGYMTPINRWHKAKRKEFDDRKLYDKSIR